MSSYTMRLWAWTVLMTVWSACILYLNLQFLEPLTGRSLGTFIYFFVITLIPMGVGLYLLFVLQSWRVTGGIMVGLALLLVFPLPSMPGIDFELESALDRDQEIVIRRTDKPGQFAAIRVPAGKRTSYSSAAGDWPEDLTFTVEYDEYRLTTNVWAFRTRTILLKATGLSLKQEER